MKLYSLLLLPFVLLQHASLVFALADPPQVADSKHGIAYIGRRTRGVEEWLSIRYGEDTGGEFRFQPARPVSLAPGSTVDASSPGNACPQPKHPLPGDPTSIVENASEDCLFVRIARPADHNFGAKKIPVMVWLHGGGHMVGTIYDVSYNPIGLVENSVEKGSSVIYVAFNYRLNIFGFALNDALVEERRTNLGLRDQQLALEWIKKNIALFGGDPENVTVFGEDTGASDLGLHIAANADHPAPFHRAISQSGSILSTWATREESSRNAFVATAYKIGCVSGSPQFWYTLNCLRQYSMAQILDVVFALAYTMEPTYGFHVFGPTVDGDVVPHDPLTLSNDPTFGKGIDFMTGWNMDESSMEIPTSIHEMLDAADFLVQRYPALVQALALMPLYLYADVDSAQRPSCPEEVSTAWCITAHLVRDIEVTCPSVMQASLIFDHNNPEGGKIKNSVYLYELNQSAFYDAEKEYGKGYLGVAHFSDVPYVFNELQSAYGIDVPEQLELAKLMSSRWAKFASAGSPDQKGHWLEAFELEARGIHGHNSQIFMADGIEERRKVFVEVLGGPDPGPREMAFKERRRCQYVNNMAAKGFFKRA